MLPRSFHWIETVAALIAVAFAAGRIVAQVPDLPGWQLRWNDEFDGTSVNSENWDVLTRQNSFNNEKQYYLPGQASVADGKLRITATNQPLANKLYRSARLESRQAFAPGRFEARIDLPTTQGMWPAFWLLPNGVQWPTGGEIDIMENRGSQPLIVSSAYHWQTNPNVPCCSQHQFVFEEYSTSAGGNPVNFHEGFHVYAVEWEATQLRFYVDGILHYTVNETANRPIFETPMNIILNLAVGGDFGGDPNGTTVFPQVMEVDYVRVWQRPAGIPGDFNSDGRVDTADYVVWRNSLGTSTVLPNDSTPGSVTQDDYNTLRTNFGKLAASGAASQGAVPEPANSLVPLTAVFVLRLLPNRGRALDGQTHLPWFLRATIKNELTIIPR